MTISPWDGAGPLLSTGRVERPLRANMQENISLACRECKRRELHDDEEQEDEHGEAGAVASTAASAASTPPHKEGKV